MFYSYFVLTLTVHFALFHLISVQNNAEKSIAVIQIQAIISVIQTCIDSNLFRPIISSLHHLLYFAILCKEVVLHLQNSSKNGRKA